MKKVLSFILVLTILMIALVLPSTAISYDDAIVDPYEGLEIESMTVKATKDLIVDYDGYEEYIYDGEDEPVGTYFCYSVYSTEPYVTVVYENGDVEEGDAYNLVGDWWISDNQFEEHWDLGTHQVTFVYREYQVDFGINIVESPYVSITAVAQKTLVDGWDGGEYEDEDGIWYNIWNCEPYFTVITKDGTVIEGDDYEICEQTGCYISSDVDQQENPLQLGTNTIKFEFVNLTCECEIEIVPNPYKSVTIKGENELYLVFEGYDEKDSFETKVIDIESYIWCETDYSIGGFLYTDTGDSYEVEVFYDMDENGMALLNKNVSINIGPCTTNTLETCNYFKAVFVSGKVLPNAVLYHETVDENFKSYTADGEADINALVAIASYGNYYYKDYETSDNGVVYEYTVDETKANIERLFGIADADVKKSDFYKNRLFGGVIRVEENWNTYYVTEDEELVFEDGKWVATADIVNWATDAVVGAVTVVLSADGTICSVDIENLDITLGDVNCDGAVTAVDARLVLQYVAGLRSEDEMYMAYADVSGDDKVSAVDARLILQKVAGII